MIVFEFDCREDRQEQSAQGLLQVYQRKEVTEIEEDMRVIYPNHPMMSHLHRYDYFHPWMMAPMISSDLYV